MTLWYRAPELILGSTEYSANIDVWSSGVFLVELLTGKPLFPGKVEKMAIDLIFQMLGTPTEETWPGVSKLKFFEEFSKERRYENRLSSFLLSKVKDIDDTTIDFISQLLSLDPTKRLSASEALAHPYFSTEPLPCQPQELPRVEGDSHEFEVRQQKKTKPKE